MQDDLNKAKLYKLIAIIENISGYHSTRTYASSYFYPTFLRCTDYFTCGEQADLTAGFWLGVKKPRRIKCIVWYARTITSALLRMD